MLRSTKWHVKICGSMSLMSSSITGRIAGVIAIVLGFIVAAVPHYIFPVCQYYGMLLETAAGTQVPMKCFWTGNAEIALGAMMIVTGLLLVVSRQKESRMLLGVVLGSLGVMVALVPTYLIGVCAVLDHPCHAGTQPALILLGVIIIIVAIITIAASRGARQE